MIEFTRIDHIAMVTDNLESQVGLFEGLFGLSRTGEWEDEEDAARGITFTLPDGLGWEVAAPTHDHSPLQAFLDGPRGPGLHHITFQVPDLADTRESLRRLGVREGRASTETRAVVSADGAGEGIQLQFTEAATTGAAAATGTGSTAASPSQGAPSLGIVAFDHVSTAFPDRDDLSRHYERLLGTRQIWRTPDGAWPDFADCILEVPGGQMHWEVIQPVGDESFITKFLDARGPAPHHVAFEVADFDAALAACEHHGVPTFDEHDDQTDGIRWRDAFIHPRHTGGLLTQIFWEEQPGTWERSDKVRPEGYVER